jgi:hypothetical protein
LFRDHRWFGATRLGPRECGKNCKCCTFTDYFVKLQTSPNRELLSNFSLSSKRVFVRNPLQLPCNIWQEVDEKIYLILTFPTDFLEPKISRPPLQLVIDKYIRRVERYLNSAQTRETTQSCKEIRRTRTPVRSLVDVRLLIQTEVRNLMLRFLRLLYDIRKFAWGRRSHRPSIRGELCRPTGHRASPRIASLYVPVHTKFRNCNG